jgi:hypothetical protein
MQRVGSRAQVMHGNAKMTGGGLKKKDLKYNKHGKIVSKKMSARAKKEKRLQKAGYVTKKGQFGAVRSMRGGNIVEYKANTDIPVLTDPSEYIDHNFFVPMKMLRHQLDDSKVAIKTGDPIFIDDTQPILIYLTKKTKKLTLGKDYVECFKLSDEDGWIISPEIRIGEWYSMSTIERVHEGTENNHSKQVVLDRKITSLIYLICLELHLIKPYELKTNNGSSTTQTIRGALDAGDSLVLDGYRNKLTNIKKLIKEALDRAIAIRGIGKDRYDSTTINESIVTVFKYVLKTKLKESNIFGTSVEKGYSRSGLKRKHNMARIYSTVDCKKCQSECCPKTCPTKCPPCPPNKTAKANTNANAKANANANAKANANANANANAKANANANAKAKANDDNLGSASELAESLSITLN